MAAMPQENPARSPNGRRDARPCRCGTARRLHRQRASARAAADGAARHVDRLEIVDRAIEHHGGDLFEQLPGQADGGFAFRELRRRLDDRRRPLRVRHPGRRRQRRARVPPRQRRRSRSPRRRADGDGRDGARARGELRQPAHVLPLPALQAERSRHLQGGPGSRGVERTAVAPGPRDLRSPTRATAPTAPTSTGSIRRPPASSSSPTTTAKAPGLRFRTLRNYRRIGGLLFYDADNYGLNTRDGGLTVDDITPTYVAEELPLVSQIELRDIHVEQLAK